jgi:hypothetical protein
VSGRGSSRRRVRVHGPGAANGQRAGGPARRSVAAVPDQVGRWPHDDLHAGRGRAACRSQASRHNELTRDCARRSLPCAPRVPVTASGVPRRTTARRSASSEAGGEASTPGAGAGPRPGPPTPSATSLTRPSAPTLRPPVACRDGCRCSFKRARSTPRLGSTPPAWARDHRYRARSSRFVRRQRVLDVGTLERPEG